MEELPSFLEQALHLLWPKGEKKLFPHETHLVLDMISMKISNIYE